MSWKQTTMRLLADILRMSIRVCLFLNGIMLGAVCGYIINQGFSDNFFSFAISHGSFELTAIVISGAAGLLAATEKQARAAQRPRLAVTVEWPRRRRSRRWRRQ